MFCSGQEELFCLLHFLDPDFFHDRDAFLEEFGTVDRTEQVHPPLTITFDINRIALLLACHLYCGPHRADTHGMPRPCQLFSQSLMDRLSLLPHIRLTTSAFDPLNAKVLMRLSLNSLQLFI